MTEIVIMLGTARGVSLGLGSIKLTHLKTDLRERADMNKLRRMLKPPTDRQKLIIRRHVDSEVSLFTIKVIILLINCQFQLGFIANMNL